MRLTGRYVILMLRYFLPAISSQREWAAGAHGCARAQSE
jgi:hypothetical protein